MNDTNTYIYGLGRIAQTQDTTTDYFLPDALGSVRQLTSSSGAVTYACAYDPGVYPELCRRSVVTTTSGASGTPYGYTGEYTTNDLVYLRARHYDPAMGRFLTRDTWGGDANNPMSLYGWVYVDDNPVNYLDPTGYCENNDDDRIATAENYVLPNGDWMTTYIAAGIAVECYGQTLGEDNVAGDYNGAGIAQISKKQTSTDYGYPVKDESFSARVKSLVGLESDPRGYGLRCYISRLAINRSFHREFQEYPCTCFTKKEKDNISDFEEKYIPEPIHDLTHPYWAVQYMRRRIKQVLDTCDYGKINCSETDKFIIAALAQNGGGFTIPNMDLSIKSKQGLLSNFRNNDGIINWKIYFPSQGNVGEFKEQLGLFYRLAKALKNDGYYLPANVLDGENKKLIEDLINGQYTN